jgi:hypothetical protein
VSVSRARIAGVTVTIAAIAAGIAIGSRWMEPAAAVAPAKAPTIAVPRAAAPITIDGHLDEPGWTKRAARTNTFLGKDGAPGRPYADARLAWDETNLYVALYAGDRDVRAARAEHDGPLWLGGDEFRLVFALALGARVVIEVSPSCVVTDARASRGGKLDYAWESGARAACDVDGTIDDPSDEDEEWVVELAIPLASLGLSPAQSAFSLGARRCDTARDGSRACTYFHDDAPAPFVLDY